MNEPKFAVEEIVIYEGREVRINEVFEDPSPKYKGTWWYDLGDGVVHEEELMSIEDYKAEQIRLMQEQGDE